jgi:hypothetical protein
VPLLPRGPEKIVDKTIESSSKTAGVALYGGDPRFFINANGRSIT